MPIHLNSVTRRDFLVALGATVVALPAFRAHAADVDEDQFAFLNDTHIGEKQKPETAIPRNLKTTVDYLLALKPRPAAVFINGDLALRDGQPGDYRYFLSLIQPLRDAGLPVHLTLGNHDDREVFYRVLTAEKPAQPVVASRHVAIVRTRRANFFLLDSLLKTMIADGDIGADQLAWVAKVLDAHTDKPAIVLVHHNPGGLVDSEPLWKILTPRQHVKAYVHGHVHRWALASQAGVHVANTPATSYVANPKLSTTGWTMARLRDNGMTLTTLTHQTDHEWHNKSHDLKWRA